MGVLNYVLGGLLILFSIAIIVVIILQEGHQQGVGVITGGADTFFGKQKGKNKDRFWSRTTAIVSVIFTLLVITLYLLV